LFLKLASLLKNFLGPAFIVQRVVSALAKGQGVESDLLPNREQEHLP